MIYPFPATVFVVPKMDITFVPTVTATVGEAGLADHLALAADGL